jgi:aminomethyltransferase
MGEVVIEGDARETGLEKVLTQKLADMPIGKCRYGFLLNEEGGICDDVIVYRLGLAKWLLVVNAATADADEAHLRKYLEKGVVVKNISSTTAKLDLQGPLSKDVLAGIAGARDAVELRYYTFGCFGYLGGDHIISRTGYTGELGYELYVPSEKAAELWAMLLRDPRVKPAGLGARDTLRLEMSYPLYGQDVDTSSNPIEADMGRFLDFSKEFIGKKALQEKSARGFSREFAYFITKSRRAPRHNFKIMKAGALIGVVTSGSFSPSLSCGIGMGYVASGAAKPGGDIVLVGDNVEIEGSFVEKPFYKNGTARR